MYTEKQREASKRWYEKNKLLLAEKRRGKRKEEHRKSYEYALNKYGREALNERARKWRETNPEKTKEVLEKSRKNFPQRNILNKARSSAKVRGLEFNLELSDIIIPKYCPYFNVPLDTWGAKDFVPSIDRIDSSKGYVKGNIEIISYLANKMKHTATQDQLVSFAKGVLNRFDNETN